MERKYQQSTPKNHCMLITLLYINFMDQDNHSYVFYHSKISPIYFAKF